MIHASELRIGNWLMESQGDDIGTIFKVLAIGLDAEGFKGHYVKHKCGSILISDGEDYFVKGIHLTHDVLKNCGFHYDSIENRWYAFDESRGYDCDFLQIDEIGNWEYVVMESYNSYYCIEDIKYLHQLQNIFYSLHEKEIKYNESE